MNTVRNINRLKLQLTINITMILLIGGCFLNVPYGYFQFMKIAACAGCAYNSYRYLSSSLSTGKDGKSYTLQ